MDNNNIFVDFNSPNNDGTSNCTNSSSSSFNVADCQLATQIVLHPYAQFARFVLLLFNTIPCILFGLFVVDYRRHPPPLHPNLKLLYMNIAIPNILTNFAYYSIEIRHLYLTITYPTGSSPCNFLCPLWFAILTRGILFFFGISSPLFHFFVMLERWRATLVARHYEREGILFGLFSILTVYSATIVYMVFFVHSILLDYNMDWQTLLPYNSTVTKSSNPFALYISYILLGLIAIIAFGDYVLIVKNKKMRRWAIIPPSSASPLNGQQNGNGNGHYSLSENYQFHENLLAMRYILPLDIGYVLLMSVYSVLTIVLRNYQPQMIFAIFLANYNLITSFPLIYISLTLVYFRRYLSYRHHSNRPQVAPVHQLGKFYFQQLNSQWNGSGSR